MIITDGAEASRLNAGIQIRVTRPGACLWALGGVQPLQLGAGGRIVGWVRVVARNQIPLGTFTEEMAAEEAMPTLNLFKRRWRRRYGKGRWSPDLLVWSLEVRPIGAPDNYRQQNVFALMEVQDGE